MKATIEGHDIDFYGSIRKSCPLVTYLLTNWRIYLDSEVLRCASFVFWALNRKVNLELPPEWPLSIQVTSELKASAINHNSPTQQQRTKQDTVDVCCLFPLKGRISQKGHLQKGLQASQFLLPSQEIFADLQLSCFWPSLSWWRWWPGGEMAGKFLSPYEFANLPSFLQQEAMKIMKGCWRAVAGPFGPAINVLWVYVYISWRGPNWQMWVYEYSQVMIILQVDQVE